MADEADVRYVLRADSSRLQADLNEAENTIRRSAQRTEKSADRIGESAERAFGQTAESAQDCGKELGNLGDNMDDVGNKSEKTADKAENKLGKALGTVGKAAAAASAAVGAAAVAVGTAAVKSADSLDKAVNRVISATGASEDAAEQYADVIKGVYGDNFGESFDDIAVSISKVTQNLGEMDNVTLQNVTERAYTLQDVFDMGVDESARAAKAMAENFGVSAEKAYDYIAKGAQDGLDYSGELLDSISEYSVQFAKLGFSADDMFNIFAQGAENGAWNLDKVGDAIKEFSIRAIDGSDTTRAGFEAIGYDAEDMAKKFAEGGDAARDAFKTVVTALSEMEDPIARDAAGVNLFGTMWEDLGADAVKALGDISDSAYDCAGAVDEIAEVNYSSLSDALGGLKRQVELLIQPLGDELIPVVSEVIDKLGKIADEVVPVLLDAAEPLVESLLDLIGPLTLIISELLPPLIEIAADIAAKISDFAARHLPTLISALKGAVDFIGKAIKVAWEMRDVIAAIVAALITFNTVIKIGNAVSAAVSALKSFKAITDAATASQIALNVAGAANPFVLIASLAAGAIGALVAFNNTTETSAEKVNELHNQAMQLNETAKDSANAAKEVGKLSDQYKALKNSADDAKETKEKLEELQKTLIDTYGQEAAKIDLVNGKYEEQLALLGELIDSKSELAEADAKAAYYTAQDAQDTEWALSLNKTDSNSDLHKYLQKWFIDESGGNYEGITSSMFSSTTDYKFKAGTTYRERYEALSRMVSRMEKYVGTDAFDSAIYNQLVQARDDMYAKMTEFEEIESTFNELTAPKQKQLIYGSKTQADYYRKMSGGGNTATLTEETPAGSEHESTYTYSGGSSSSTGSQGNFISITSYVPTMWDNDQTAALKSLIGKDVLGKTTSAHQINALTGAISGAAESSSASKETDLADVINAITKLQRKVERFEDAFGDMTIELTAGDLTIGKACVRDCNIMAKRSGKSPFNF